MPSLSARICARWLERRAEQRALPQSRGRVSKFLIPEVIFGIGTLAEVGGAVRRVGGVRPMLVSDAGVLGAGWVERALPPSPTSESSGGCGTTSLPTLKDVEVEAAFATVAPARRQGYILVA